MSNGTMARQYNGQNNYVFFVPTADADDSFFFSEIMNSIPTSHTWEHWTPGKELHEIIVIVLNKLSCVSRLVNSISCSLSMMKTVPLIINHCLHNRWHKQVTKTTTTMTATTKQFDCTSYFWIVQRKRTQCNDVTWYVKGTWRPSAISDNRKTMLKKYHQIQFY